MVVILSELKRGEKRHNHTYTYQPRHDYELSGFSLPPAAKHAGRRRFYFDRAAGGNRGDRDSRELFIAGAGQGAAEGARDILHEQCAAVAAGVVDVRG